MAGRKPMKKEKKKETNKVNWEYFFIDNNSTACFKVKRKLKIDWTGSGWGYSENPDNLVLKSDY